MLTTKRYIRKGECARCGDCCQNENCEHFEMDEGIANCKIHNSPDRPNKCIWFPQAPPIIFKRCGYYFEDTWENNRIVGAMEV